MRDYPFIYSQRDPQWAAQRLGTVNGITIGGYGCILTCQAMKAGYYNHEIKPNALDDIFTNRNIYQQGDLLPDVGIHQIFDDIKLIDTKVYSGPADMNYLKQLSADATKTVTIEVDFDHDPNDGIQTHFVELHSFDGTHLRIYDPWYGQEDDFTTHYGTNPQVTIQKLSVYQGAPTKQQMSIDSDLFSKLVANSTANDAVCDELGLAHDAGKDAEVAAIAKLKADKSSAEQTATNLNKQIPDLEIANKKLQGAVDILQPKADKLDEIQPLYDQAEIDLKKVREDYGELQKTANRSTAQTDNTNYTKVGTPTLVQEVLKRWLHLS